MTIDEVKNVFHKYLFLPNDSIIDLLMGVVVANQLDIDSVNLYIVGPSGSGKTELIRSLNRYSRVYPMGNMTANTFTSGYGGEKHKGKASLLLKLQGQGKRIVTIKEFTAVLNMRDESRREILSQIREIADGEVNRNVGNDVEIHWKGKLAFIAGVTGVIDKHFGVTQELGERFVYYRTTTDRELMPKYALANTGRVSEMREALASTVATFLNQFDSLDLTPVPIREDVLHRIFLLSQFIAGSRSGISRDRFHHTLDYMIEIEVGTRLVQQLQNVAIGVALIQGKDAVDMDIYDRVITRIGRDSTHSIRRYLLHTMWHNNIHGDNWTYQSHLATICGKIPRTTIRTYLEDMVALGILEDREGIGRLEYRISDEWINLIHDCGVYENVILPTNENLEYYI
uniref:Putative ATPase domain containing protein n=1 Tax=viral metagenome TaxID=1070528 RepID=A0A6H1Z8A8_9ZZZZ